MDGLALASDPEEPGSNSLLPLAVRLRTSGHESVKIEAYRNRENTAAEDLIYLEASQIIIKDVGKIIEEVTDILIDRRHECY